jgi:CHASE3 domain sensor protein
LDGTRAVTRAAPAVVGTPIEARGRTGLLWSAIAASAVAVLAVAVVLAILAAALFGQRDSNARVRESERILRTASDAERSVVDMETGLRGYVLTRDPTFLAPYRIGVRAGRAQTNALVALTADQPPERAAAARVRGQVADYVTAYAQPVVRLVRRAPVQARSRDTTAEGKRRVDELRAGFAQITAWTRERAARTVRRAGRSWPASAGCSCCSRSRSPSAPTSPGASRAPCATCRARPSG